MEHRRTALNQLHQRCSIDQLLVTKLFHVFVDSIHEFLIACDRSDATSTWQMRQQQRRKCLAMHGREREVSVAASAAAASASAAAASAAAAVQCRKEETIEPADAAQYDAVLRKPSTEGERPDGRPPRLPVFAGPYLDKRTLMVRPHPSPPILSLFLSRHRRCIDVHRLSLQPPPSPPPPWHGCRRSISAAALQLLLPLLLPGHGSIDRSTSLTAAVAASCCCCCFMDGAHLALSIARLEIFTWNTANRWGDRTTSSNKPRLTAVAAAAELVATESRTPDIMRANSPGWRSRGRGGGPAGAGAKHLVTRLFRQGRLMPFHKDVP